jgi:hypothetical protein
MASLVTSSISDLAVKQSPQHIPSWALSIVSITGSGDFLVLKFS